MALTPIAFCVGPYYSSSENRFREFRVIVWSRILLNCVEFDTEKEVNINYNQIPMFGA